MAFGVGCNGSTHGSRWFRLPLIIALYNGTIRLFFGFKVFVLEGAGFSV